MQTVETEIGRADSPYFGEVVCLADESGNPCFWAIKKKMDFLNIVDNDLIIALDLYCYDRNFVSSSSDARTEKINNNVKAAYEVFQNDCKMMDELFVKEFNSEKSDCEIGEEIESIDDVKRFIKVVRVEIMNGCYNIVFMLNDEEWVLEKDTSANTWSLLPSKQAPYPEMEF